MSCYARSERAGHALGAPKAPCLVKLNPNVWFWWLRLGGRRRFGRLGLWSIGHGSTYHVLGLVLESLSFKFQVSAVLRDDPNNVVGGSVRNDRFNLERDLNVGT